MPLGTFHLCADLLLLFLLWILRLLYDSGFTCEGKLVKESVFWLLGLWCRIWLRARLTQIRCVSQVHATPCTLNPDPSIQMFSTKNLELSTLGIDVAAVAVAHVGPSATGEEERCRDALPEKSHTRQRLGVRGT